MGRVSPARQRRQRRISVGVFPITVQSLVLAEINDKRKAHMEWCLFRFVSGQHRNKIDVAFFAKSASTENQICFSRTSSLKPTE